MRMMQMADAVRYRTMTTAELRETFLLTDLFQPGRIDLAYMDLDRTVIGSAVPLDQPLTLPTDYALKAAYFTERRELGILNNKQAAVSPGWSIHAGVGTASYTFCWGVGGENQDYGDMDKLAIAELL